MSWLERLKKPGMCPDPHPAKTTKVVSVVSVGSPPARSDGNRSDTPRQEDQGPPRLSLVLDAPEEGGLAGSMQQAGPGGGPDAYCWPASSAMNGAEIVTFMERTARFTDRGMRLPTAEALADRLVLRDREGDDRKTCMECRNMRRNGGCAVAHLAMPIGEMSLALQRCSQFFDAGKTWH